MKKIFLLLLITYGQLYALEVKSTLKLYHDLMATITHKNHITLYTANKEYIEVFSHSNKIQVVSSPSSADVILVTRQATLKKISTKNLKRAISFATKYSLLKASPYIIGALYSKRGRTQIHFIQRRLRRHHIILPPKYAIHIIGEP